jgi:hypothetical protein
MNSKLIPSYTHVFLLRYDNRENYYSIWITNRVEIIYGSLEIVEYTLLTVEIR